MQSYSIKGKLAELLGRSLPARPMLFATGGQKRGPGGTNKEPGRLPVSVFFYLPPPQIKKLKKN